MVIEDARLSGDRGARRDPDLIDRDRGVPFLRLVTGNAGGPTLFLKGDLKLDGDLLLAPKLPRLFRPARR